jgi:glutathione S-transferase
MRLTLFHAPNACSMASYLALEEAGADYEVVRLDLRGGEQRRPEYLAVNPKGRVPALACDRGTLTESVAILAYIAQAYPRARLAPLDDPFAFARLQAFNAYLASTVHVAYAHNFRGARWADDPAAIAEMKRKAPQVFADSFGIIEDGLAEGGWVMGEAYSVGDPYLFTFATWMANVGVDIARFPRVQDHARRMRERPAVRKVLAENEA